MTPTGPARRSTWEVIGVMSGSSTDGMDLAWCRFSTDDTGWKYHVHKARTFPYDDAFRSRLSGAMNDSALEAARLHRDLGIRIGEACLELLDGGTVDLIASHGHTLFHKPEEGLTAQIGCGARIAAITGTTTVCDFRTTDVALGGQGAPLVPLGEKLLFPDHKAFLNIGGICNIALHRPERVIGYDVCIGNQALNFLAAEAGLPYDANGELARSGKPDATLLDKLNALPFHHRTPPRSLGREWFDEQLRPLIADRSIPLPDRMRTIVEHIATQLASALKSAEGPVLVTGGGAHNGFLMEQLRSVAQVDVDIPAPEIVDFKEALIFALLGVLRLNGSPTALTSVTGASRDNVGGAVYLPN